MPQLFSVVQHGKSERGFWRVGGGKCVPLSFLTWKDVKYKTKREDCRRAGRMVYSHMVL